MNVQIFTSDFCSGIASKPLPSRLKRLSKRKMKKHAKSMLRKAYGNSHVKLPATSTAIFSTFR